MKEQNFTDQEMWAKINEEFQRLVQVAGVDPNFTQEVEDILGVNQGDLKKLEEETLKMMMTKKIKVKKIHPDAVTPKYAYPSDSGFDLHSVEEIIVPALGRALVPTGLIFQFDENLEIQVRPKSGLAIKQGLTVLNSPGTVDHGYTGECKVPIFNTNNFDFTITKGMKIAQAVLCPVFMGKNIEIVDTEELENRDRGSNGFGSTGI